MATIDQYRIELSVDLKQFSTGLAQADKLYKTFYAKLVATTMKGESDIQKVRAKYGQEAVKRWKDEAQESDKTTETIVKNQHRCGRAAKERTEEEIKQAKEREKGERTSIQNMQAVSTLMVEETKKIGQLRNQGEKATGSERLAIYQKMIQAEIELETLRFTKSKQGLNYDLNFRAKTAQQRMKIEEQIAAQTTASTNRITALKQKSSNAEKQYQDQVLGAALKRFTQEEKAAKTSAQNQQATSKMIGYAYQNVADVQERLAVLTGIREVSKGKMRKALHKDVVSIEIELERALFQQKEALLRAEMEKRGTTAQQRMKLEQQIAATSAASSKRIEGMNTKLANTAKTNWQRTAEIGENFQTISRGLQQGDFAGVGGFLGGVKGGVIGMAVDGLAVVGEKLLEMGEKSLAVTKEFEVLGNTVELMGGDVGKAGGMGELRGQIEAIHRPLGMSTEGIAKLAQTVATFESPENIAKTTEAVLNLSQISPSTSPEAIATGLNRFGKALGDTALAADIMATAGVELKGKSMDPVNDAASHLGSIFAAANMTLKDSGQAAKEASTIFIGLTKTGLDVGSAGSQAEAAFISMNKVMMNPRMLETIANKLPKGISLMDIGLEKGNVSVTKLVGSLSNMGEKGQQIATMLGGAHGKAGLGILVDQAQKSGVSIDQLATKFDNVSGAAGRAAGIMSTELGRTKEAFAQNMESIELGIGNTVAGIVSGVQQMTGGIVSSIADWFKSASQRFAESKAELDTLSAAAANITSTTAKIKLDLEAGDTAKAIGDIRSSLVSVGEIDEGIAETLTMILDAPGTRTKAELQGIVGYLEDIAELAALDKQIKAAETMDLALDKLDDSLGESVKALQKVREIGRASCRERV